RPGPEAQLVLNRRDERTHHRILLCHISERRAVYLTLPEQYATNVPIAPQVAKVLRHHKRAVVFRIDKRAVVDAAIAALQVVVSQPIDHCGAAAQSDERRSLR